MGGYVDPNEQRISNSSLGNSIIGGFNAAVNIGKLAKSIKDDAKKDKDDPNEPITDTTSTLDSSAGAARGGRIKHTMGKRIGKDDGLIPAQRGEYVVRKSAVKKLGNAALNTINRGKIPPRKGR